MAESPGAPETISSYSDPLYDRLETVVRQMGRKWWLILLLVLIIAGVAVFLQQRAMHAPEAVSATAFLQASDEAGIEALATVADDADVLPEFRARAALEAANRALQDADAERAASLLATAETQAAATSLKDLQLTITASQAAVLEEQGEYEEAEARYLQVVDQTATSLPGLNLMATLGAARSAMLRAQNTEDPGLAAELRAQAHEQFTFASERSLEGADQLIDYARFQRYDLERRHPELAGAAPTAEPTEDEAAAEEPAAEGEGEQPAAEEPAAEGESEQPAAEEPAAE